MPPFNALKDQQVADVLTYIRNNFGNKASAVSSAEVQKVRTSVKKK
jgi:mono/diheme cytochrome c family protein